jgi:hypothetical protein
LVFTQPKAQKFSRVSFTKLALPLQPIFFSGVKSPEAVALIGEKTARPWYNCAKIESNYS